MESNQQTNNLLHVFSLLLSGHLTQVLVKYCTRKKYILDSNNITDMRKIFTYGQRCLPKYSDTEASTTYY